MVKLQWTRFVAKSLQLGALTLITTAIAFTVPLATWEAQKSFHIRHEIIISGWIMSKDSDFYRGRALDRSSYDVSDLRTAVQLNQFSSSTSLLLANRLEVAGETSEAESNLLNARAHDAGLEPMWALANFYLRRGNLQEFFAWANRYRAFTPEPSAALLRLSLETGLSLESVLAHFKPVSCPEFVQFLPLIDSRRMNSEPIVEGLIRCDDDLARAELSRHVSRMLDRNEPRLAGSQWVHSGRRINLFDEDFATSLTGEGFDWRVNESPGIQVMRSLGQSGLDIEIAPGPIQPSVVVFQPVVLAPGIKYRVDVSLGDGPAEEGLQGELVELTTGSVRLSQHKDLHDIPEDDLHWEFLAPETDHSLALAMIYPGGSANSSLGHHLTLKTVKLTAKLF